MTLTLPTGPGTFEEFELSAPGPWRRPQAPLTSRIAFSAAHVAVSPFGDNTPGARPDVDWDASLAFRHDIWSWGLGVADAMDTAQRGMGMDWATTRELIQRSSAHAHSVGGRIACGAGTDQLDERDLYDGAAGLRRIIDAYREQIDVIENAGAHVIIMASRALARIAITPADYRFVYDAVLDYVGAPVILHWLGTAFDPALHGYWGSADTERATRIFLDFLVDHHAMVDGVKVSLLDAGHERRLRAALPRGLRMYTGDDFNYPELIVGDELGHSDALLGIFAAIAPAASSAIQALDAGEDERARMILDSTQRLGRHIFQAPTFNYKTGIAFLAWLGGHQDAFVMAAGMQSARSPLHLVELFRLADAAGLLTDPELAADRMTAFLAVNGLTRPSTTR